MSLLAWASVAVAGVAAGFVVSEPPARRLARRLPAGLSGRRLVGWPILLAGGGAVVAVSDGPGRLRLDSLLERSGSLL